MTMGLKRREKLEMNLEELDKQIANRDIIVNMARKENCYKTTSYLWRSSSSDLGTPYEGALFVMIKTLSLLNNDLFPSAQNLSAFFEAEIKILSEATSKLVDELGFLDETRQGEHPYITHMKEFLSFTSIDCVQKEFEDFCKVYGKQELEDFFEVEKLSDGENVLVFKGF